MKKTLKVTSYGLSTLILVIIAGFFLRSYLEVLNSGMETRITHLGMLFQSFKILFIAVNLIGIILCLFLIFKKSKKLNKSLLGLVFINFIYSMISFLWVAIVYQISENPQEKFMSYVFNTVFGKTQVVWELGVMAPMHVIRFSYLLNFLNSLIMVVSALILISIKHVVDKKIKRL